MPIPFTLRVTFSGLTGLVRPVRRTRAGVTLLELVVVLTVLALSALAVPPLLGSRASATADSRTQLVVQARREALRRGERVWLRVAEDGAWVMAVRQGTEVLLTGRVPAPAPGAAPVPVMDVTIDALGACQPGPGVGGVAGATLTFDMLACGWAEPVGASESQP